MLSQFCIRRPIFATVLSLFIVLAGLVALRVLPLSQYPNITPPSVRIRQPTTAPMRKRSPVP